MVAMMLSSLEDVREARECVWDLAQAAGIGDAGAAALAAAELGNNCVEHGGPAPGLLFIGCAPGQLSLRFVNRCDRRPDWGTRKPIEVEEFRAGGYGLPLVRALAGSVDWDWAEGRAVVRALFP